MEKEARIALIKSLENSRHCVIGKRHEMVVIDLDEEKKKFKMICRGCLAEEGITQEIKGDFKIRNK